MTRRRFLAMGLAAGAASAVAPGAVWAAADRAGLAGRYDGGQMEIAAELELGTDGRFRYGLAYGALDEEATGRWEVDAAAGAVLLTSDPVTAPKFVLVEARPLAPWRQRLVLDVPAGMDRQYFNARLTLSNGRTIEKQFADDGLDVGLAPGVRVVSVVLMLPVYELESAPLDLPTQRRGSEAHFRFDANDLGKVAFDRQRLAIEPGGLRLARFDRSLLFRRVGE